MKHIFLISFIALFSLSCSAQNTINSNELTVNGVVVMGENKSVLTSSFGNPIEIIKDFSEMDNADMYTYKYNGLSLTVIENKVSAFVITKSKYVFTKHNIKIGGNIDNLKNIFPVSYNKKKDKGILLFLKDYDKNLFISHNDLNIITGIAIYTY